MMNNNYNRKKNYDIFLLLLVCHFGPSYKKKHKVVKSSLKSLYNEKVPQYYFGFSFIGAHTIL